MKAQFLLVLLCICVMSTPDAHAARTSEKIHSAVQGCPRDSLPTARLSGSSDLLALRAFLRFLGQADGICLMRIANITSPPGFWSGYIEAIQTVSYVLLEVIERREDWNVPDHIDVRFLVLQGSPWIDPDEPRLRRDMFASGKTHLVLFLPQNVFDERGARLAYAKRMGSVVVYEWALSRATPGGN